MAYQLMAGLYDKLMEDAPYDKWVEFTEKVLARYNQKDVKLVDLGCGTGEVSIRLAEKGFHVSGVDFAQDMLTIAEQKAAKRNLQIQWIHQDLIELKGLSGLDVALSYCDVINYITTKEDVLQVFSNVFHSLKEEGIFIFDVHSLSHVHHHLANQTFADVTEDSSYIWFCYEGESEGEMYHDLTFYSQQGDTYIRFDETHHQQTYPVDTYIDLLKIAGFEILTVCGDFFLEKHFSEDEAERIFFIAQKRTR
ncbi:class I SAM-dependent DNA methyltransferase [Ornithinibacillus xuwenensis]|jgi:SAM-dependent methyltransferase|uniref:Class I SAM-dependent methyltransferase n=1 Tax=Ornithinibacillus xuwenensis TaxID=3144668 RepID=A0ABU9XCD9_9BACI